MMSHDELAEWIYNGVGLYDPDEFTDAVSDLIQNAYDQGYRDALDNTVVFQFSCGK